MDRAFKNIPLLRVFVALVSGILISNFLPNTSGAVYVSIATALLSGVVFLHFNYSYRNETVFGITVLLLFCSIGAGTYRLYNKKPEFDTRGIFLGTVLETPAEKTKSFKTIIRISQFYGNGLAKNTDETLIAYFAKTDSARKIEAGNQILFLTSPTPIANRGNPYEFDYKKYLERQRVYRQVYLSGDSWKKAGNVPGFSATIAAEKLRNHFLEIYRQQNLGETEFEILAALLIGYRRELDPEVIQVFSNTGAMHVLSVSGLHVGILFWVLNLLLGFLKKNRKGRYVYVALIAGIIWFYAFLTGLSPSVERAALMISFYIVGENLIRKANIYNTLTASALILLLLNPNNLFDVGFQLSYLAVFGIVFLQPRFDQIYKPQNRIARFFWPMLTVSVAAQIATLPLTLYYFNQFPVYFLLTNLFIIPVSEAIIPVGILLLIFHKIPVLSDILAFLVKWIMHIGYFCLKWIDNLPNSVSIYNIDETACIVLCLILFFSFLYIGFRLKKNLQISLALFAFLLLYSDYMLLKNLKSRYIIVFNSPENGLVFLKTGKHSYFVAEKGYETDNPNSQIIGQLRKKIDYTSIVYLPKDTVYEDEYIYLNKGLFSFQGKNIAFGPVAMKNSQFLDFIVVPRGVKITGTDTVNNSKLILFGNLPPSQQQNFPDAYLLQKHGAFRCNL